MASMATGFARTRSPAALFLGTQPVHFGAHLEFSVYRFPGVGASRKCEGRWIRPALRVQCSLIDPDGGSLMNLIVPDGRGRETKRREALLSSEPRIKLSRIDLEWVHVLSEGWASPLRGFMREAEFLQTLHFNCLRLEDGTVVNMSVPIVLAIDDSQKQAIGKNSKVTLVDDNNKPVAILSKSAGNLLVIFLFDVIYRIILISVNF